MASIRQPVLCTVDLGRATSQGTPTVLKAKLVEVATGGSAIFVISAPAPGCELILEAPDNMRQRIAEGDFIRPGQDFTRFYIRHQMSDGGKLLLAVYPPVGVYLAPVLARVNVLPRVRGVALGNLTEGAGTAWKMRLQNTEPVGSGKLAYVRSIDMHVFGGLTVEVRVDVDQDLTSGVGGETASAIQWANALAGVTPPHLPAVQMLTKGGAWADPPAAGVPAAYTTVGPDSSVTFDPPYPLMPQKEIRIQHLTSPGVRMAATADVSGEVVPTVG